MVVDNGCDQSIININSFLVHSFAGVYYDVGGALQNMRSSHLQLVNCAFTLVTLPDNSKVIFKLNQCFLDSDPSQSEALLQPHQARAFGVVVDDCSNRHLGKDGKPGGQCLSVHGVDYPMHFDGWKCYYRISKPTAADLDLFPIIEITSPQPYEPQHRRSSRRLPTSSIPSIDEWRRRLGYPTQAITNLTLKNTTSFIKNTDADSRDYLRDHYKPRFYAL